MNHDRILISLVTVFAVLIVIGYVLAADACSQSGGVFVQWQCVEPHRGAK